MRPTFLRSAHAIDVLLNGPAEHRVLQSFPTRRSSDLIEALGRPRTAQVKRDAVRGEAEAEREARAARYLADTEIEASRRDFETNRSKYELEVQNSKAQADLAYELQKAITSQQVRAEQL